MSTIHTTPDEAMARYRATAQQRWAEEERALIQRKARAWAVAHEAAQLLRHRFGATQVLLFGSLAHGHWFSSTSDIDLAAWGVPDAEYFRAVAHLQDLSPEFSIDLVAMERCKPSLREAILSEGKPL